VLASVTNAPSRHIFSLINTEIKEINVVPYICVKDYHYSMDPVDRS